MKLKVYCGECGTTDTVDVTESTAFDLSMAELEVFCKECKKEFS